MKNIKKAFIFGMLSISCTAFAGPAATEISHGPAMTHNNCKISLNSYNNIKDSLKANGFTLATYEMRYQFNGKGPEKLATMPLDESDLVSRFKKLDKGEAELQAKLESIRYSGAPELRIYNKDGSAISIETTKTPTHLGTFVETNYEVSDTALIRAAFVNVFENAQLESADANWFKIQFKAIHETTVVETKAFTLRSEARKLLANDKSIDGQDKIGLSVIAGYKVSESDRKETNDEHLQDLRKALIGLKLVGKMNEEEFRAKIDSALPTCQVVKAAQ